MGGLTAPMVLEGTRCKIEKVERGDYEGDDICQYDENGKAIMAIVTTRDDGTDCTVLAPTATAKGMA